MKRLRVLLVDDEKDFLEVMKTRILSWDSIIYVATAEDGKEALKLFKEKGTILVKNHKHSLPMRIINQEY